MTRAHTLAFVLAVAAEGCALGDGEGFGRLEPGRVEVGLEIGPAREVSYDALVTDLGYQVELSECSLELDRFELQTLLAAGSGNTRFDPANPPAGWTLCHGGHCHAEDGSLESYEEVQAKLAGGTARWEAVATAKLDRTFDLLEPDVHSLRNYEPQPELPRVVLGRAAVFGKTFRCRGQVRAGDAEPRALALDLSLAAEPMSVPLDESISRDGPETLTPAVRIRVGGSLFDEIDFAAIEGAPIRIDDGSEAAALTVERLVEATTLTVALKHGKD